jgi:ABC-type transport system substrate-binding protein
VLPRGQRAAQDFKGGVLGLPPRRDERLPLVLGHRVRAFSNAPDIPQLDKLTTD